MSGLRLISCVRFAMQLLIGESVYVLGWKLRGKGAVRLLLALPEYFLACALAFGLFSWIPINGPVVYILYYVALFAISLGTMRLCFDVKWAEILFAGVCGYATQHIAFGAITVISQLTGLSLSPVADFFLIRLLPYVLISAGIWFFVIRRYAGKGTVRDRDMRMVVLALGVLFTVIFISVLVDDRVFRESSALLQNVFCKLYAIVCCLLAIFVAYFMSRQNLILRENEMMEQMLRQSEEQQKLSQETINIINIKCHDLKYRLSHLPVADSGQKEYIESVSDALAIYDNTFETGNDALDLVLTEKSLLCSQYHIKFSCMADGQALASLSSPDLYALFGNLMDNAIESVMKEPDEDKRIVSLTISRRGQGSHVHIENHCGEVVEFEDDLPLTTKTDKDNHGFGVRSIRYIVQDVLRGEWGFKGMVLSDYFGNYGYMDADKAVRGGTDIMLGTAGNEAIMTDQTSATSVLAMRQAVKNVFYTAVNSSAYENYTPGSIPGWLMTTYIVDAAIIALLAVLEVITVRSYLKKKKNG